MKIDAIARTLEREPSGLNFSTLIRTLYGRISKLARRAPKRLRLCESLALGDRRFVAVVEYENSQFLLGGTSGSLTLLARLGTSEAPSIQPSPDASADRGEA